MAKLVQGKIFGLMDLEYITRQQLVEQGSLEEQYVANHVCGKVFWPEHSALLRQVQFKFLQVVIGKKWDITLLFAMIIHVWYIFLTIS